MKEHNNRSALRPAFIAMGVLGSAVLPGILVYAQEEGPPRGRPGAPPAGVTAAHFYKNIKVLKTLPANQLIPTMQHINQSLGVDCGFCHVRGNFASDAKPEKNVARQMVVMTNSLNAHQKILDKHATCYMCHHGHPQPETQIPSRGEMNEEQREPPPPPPPPPPGQ